MVLENFTRFPHQKPVGGGVGGVRGGGGEGLRSRFQAGGIGKVASSSRFQRSADAEFAPILVLEIFTKFPHQKPVSGGDVVGVVW